MRKRLNRKSLKGILGLALINIGITLVVNSVLDVIDRGFVIPVVA